MGNRSVEPASLRLPQRTRAFALRVIHLVQALPGNKVSDVLGKQLLRAATSVGANYRAACRARSKAEFIAKLGIVEEEADESGYWLDLIVEAKLLPEKRVKSLRSEADAITAMIVASIRTAKGTRRQEVSGARLPRQREPVQGSG